MQRLERWANYIKREAKSLNRLINKQAIHHDLFNYLKSKG